MAAYEDMPSGEMRRAVASGSFAMKGDVNKMAQAMIDCADRSSPALRRLTLGASAYFDPCGSHRPDLRPQCAEGRRALGRRERLDGRLAPWGATKRQSSSAARRWGAASASYSGVSMIFRSASKLAYSTMAMSSQASPVGATTVAATLPRNTGRNASPGATFATCAKAAMQRPK